MPLQRLAPLPLKVRGKRAAAQTPAPTTEKEHTIIVGVDFRTTYSGLAWTSSKNPDAAPDIITSWPSLSDLNADDAKVASKLDLDDNSGWGYVIPKNGEVIQWFKLLLIDEGKLPEGLRKSVDLRVARHQLEAHQLAAEDIVSKYLANLWEHATKEIKRTAGTGFFSKSRIRVVMTLPAIWDAAAQNKMKNAAETAGIPMEGLAFISEPEAAAIATIRDCEDKSDLGTNDCFVIIDCGRGTVDGISYQIVKEKPLELKEIVKGEGNLFGATTIDVKFKAMLEEKCGDLWDQMSAQEQQDILERVWEHGMKRRFDGSKGRDIKLPRIENISDDQRRISVTAKEIAGLFEESFKNIKQMVDNQCECISKKTNKPAKYVILVGGYGRSPFLHEALVEHLANAGQVEVLQARDDKPWTAIARGAAIHGLSLEDDITSSLAVNISSRIARQSYGVACDEPFRPGYHAKRDLKKAKKPGEDLAVNQMQWYLKIGQDVDTKNAMEKPFFDCFPEIPEQINIEVLSSEADYPPRRYDQHEGRVQVNSILRIDANAIDWNDVPRKKSPSGQKLYYLKIFIRMVCRGNAMHFEVKDGQTHAILASQQVLVDFAEQGTSNGMRFLRHA